jgi:hypothetical protein
MAREENRSLEIPMFALGVTYSAGVEGDLVSHLAALSAFT